MKIGYLGQGEDARMVEIEPEHEREAALYERSLAHPHGSPRGDDGALGSSLEAARAAAEALDQTFRDPRAARSDAIGRE